MTIALKARDKYEFVTGEEQEPAARSPLRKRWQRIDNLVTSWILNSISKDLVEAFLYYPSSKDLWNELTTRYGESNGPMIYQIRKDISVTIQGNQTVANYYTKLKKLWDELACLRPIPKCTCGIAERCTCDVVRAASDLDGEEKLMQFLLGLNDTYDNVKNQILLMDPFPSMSKAYSMVLSVEKQSEVNTAIYDSSENSSAMYVQKSNYNSRNTSNRSRSKADKHCDHYNGTGRTKETCCKLTGYPD
ncbi:uncharacterized protein LOC119371159 [Jatropha curcas]|uniref:uncharacterized protein LOC119371159 n=1 Tax=Jatropha curcas TaxID=180498 RepID=UPI001893C70F|nr:uncharacterized protein LOC119371159 [Jatropha curcas]